MQLDFRVVAMSISLPLAACATPGDRVAPAPSAFVEEGPCVGVVPIYREPPVYPQKAAEAGESGRVALTYNISAAGQTSDVTVVDSSPSGVFDGASIASLQGWRYPNTESGHVGCRELLIFKLER